MLVSIDAYAVAYSELDVEVLVGVATTAPLQLTGVFGRSWDWYCFGGEE